MLNFGSIISDNELKCRFRRVASCSDEWYVFVEAIKEVSEDLTSTDYVEYGVYDCRQQAFSKSHGITDSENIVVNDITENEIISEFTVFSNHCPKAIVGDIISEDIIEQDDRRVDVFERLLIGAAMLQYGDDSGVKYAKRCIDWLRNTDFYSAPASTKYHDSEPGGLLKHTLRVVNKIIELSQIPSFSSIPIEEAIIVAIAHDWCKIGLYEQYMRNVKDEQTGAWHQVPSYRCKGPSIPFGHGTASMYIAQKFFRLSIEQALAIRWHMGEYNVADSESHDYYEANENYPLVSMLQFADRLSIMKQK